MNERKITCAFTGHRPERLEKKCCYVRQNNVWPLIRRIVMNGFMNMAAITADLTVFYSV